VLEEFPMITLPYAEQYFGQDIVKVRCRCLGGPISQFSTLPLCDLEQDKNNLESVVL